MLWGNIWFILNKCPKYAWKECIHAYLEDFVGLVPNHCSNMKITIKQVTQYFATVPQCISQGSNPCLPHCRQIHWATWKALGSFRKWCRSTLPSMNVVPTCECALRYRLTKWSSQTSVFSIKQVYGISL